jgi:hypothetical protein
VLGTTDSTTITASQVIVGYKLGSSATAATVIPFQKGTPTDSKEVGRSRRTGVRGRGRSSAEPRRIRRPKLRWPPTRGPLSTVWCC